MEGMDCEMTTCMSKQKQWELLLVNSKQALTDLAKFYGVRGYSKFNKSELAELIGEHMNQNLNKIIIGFDDETWLKFKELCETSSLYKPEEMTGYEHLIELGMAHLIEDGSESYIGLAADIRQKYTEVDGTLLEEARKKQGLWRRYRKGCVNLYGAVEISWVIELFDRDYPDYLTFEEIWEAIMIDKMVGYDFQIIKDYFVHESLYLLDAKDFDNLIAARTIEDYYEPTKGQIKNYSDQGYYERTLQVQALESYLKKTFKGITEDAVEDAITEVVLAGEMELAPDAKLIGALIEQLNCIGFEINTLDEMQVLTGYIIKVLNNTRTWVNKGFTPQELLGDSKNENPPVTTSIPVKKLDVGRNAPCPCGSGIKYKKCCGK
ncbi:MAG: SEC-C metal-binding domain-containing protein [Cellulosilyticaceae bacterium]